MFRLMTVGNKQSGKEIIRRKPCLGGEDFYIKTTLKLNRN